MALLFSRNTPWAWPSFSRLR